jgi:hypothetical protein
LVFLKPFNTVLNCFKSNFGIFFHVLRVYYMYYNLLYKINKF